MTTTPSRPLDHPDQPASLDTSSSKLPGPESSSNPKTPGKKIDPEGKVDDLSVATLPGRPHTMPEENELVESPTRDSEDHPSMDTLLNLDEIEAAGTNRISKAAWAYYYSAADDLVTKRLNNEAYRAILLRPRVFIDVKSCDLSTKLLGHPVHAPFFVSPAAMAGLAHPSGEHGIAQACAKFGVMQIISSNASMSPEQTVDGAAPGQIFGWQMYVQIDKSKSEDMLARIGKLADRIKFICLTLDAPTPGKREDDERSKKPTASPHSGSYNEPSSAPTRQETAGMSGIGATLYAGTDPSLTWEKTLPWLAAHSPLPIVLKGIQTHEDALLAAQHSPPVRAILISNHGGRGVDTAAPAIYTLLEIRKYCPEVFDKVEVWIDGGIRRGTDVVKALCLGAKGVGLGRSPLWGLGAGGVEGVERVFGVLKAEVETCMRLLGVTRVEDLGLRHLNTSALTPLIYSSP